MNIKHLKAKILDLAIRGKLVPQNLSEGNAADLLKEHNNIPEDETPFEIPESWCWCRLHEISVVKSSKRVFEKDYVKNGIPFYRSLEIGQLYRKEIIKPSFFISEEHYNELKQTNEMPRIGDILITSVGSIGNTWICDDRKFYYKDGNVTQICKSDAFISLYMDYYLHSSVMYNQVNNTVGGSAYNALTIEKLKALLIPLPPLQEQQRIVSAIEKTFEQIDIIEKNKLNLKTYIKQAKNKILDLAIRGKLVEQISQEGNATDLLQKIRDEKTELIKQKKLKEDKKSSFIIKSEDGKHYEQFKDGTLKDIEEEIPFKEPEGWTWCRINEIAIDMADGPFGSNLKSEHYTNNKEARIIQLSNLSDEGWREENKRYTTIKHATENISRSIVEPGNIVIAKMMPAGRAMICPDKEQMYVLSSDCVKLVPIEGVNKQFLVRALNSPFFRNRVVDNVQGVTRQRTSISKLRSCFFPLPPFEEQKRIVDKLEQVLQQLDILEKSLGE